MNSDTVIQVSNLGKHYYLGGIRTSYKTLRDSLAGAAIARFRAFREKRAEAEISRGDNEIWALKDVSFEVKRGEVVGIIGRNGAGKSTLLKILSRITEPTEGYADIHGRVGALLEVGTGFHPELTGRENIYLNGAILGMRRADLERQFDEMVAFSEVEKFIDTPVKHYSSGMYLRLAFAVAAHLEPEVLLVDEVLAVGDHAFQKKCLGKMEEVARQGRTVLFVSHNMSAVKELCQRGILLESGEVVFNSDSAQCIAEYTRRLENETVTTGGKSKIFAVGVPQVSGMAGSKVLAGEPFNIVLRVTGRKVQNPWMFFIVEDFTGRALIHSRIKSREHGVEIIDGEYRLELEIPSLWLSPGVYSAYFKFLFPSVNAATGRLVSERFMLEICGELEQSGKAVLNPDIEWKITKDVEEAELVSL